MQQTKSAEKQRNVKGEATVYENRRLDSVRKNFAFGLQKEFKSPSPDGNAFRLNNQTNRN
jgi:hypothetical protein